MILVFPSSDSRTAIFSTILLTLYSIPLKMLFTVSPSFVSMADPPMLAPSPPRSYGTTNQFFCKEIFYTSLFQSTPFYSICLEFSLKQVLRFSPDIACEHWYSPSFGIFFLIVSWQTVEQVFSSPRPVQIMSIPPEFDDGTSDYWRGRRIQKIFEAFFPDNRSFGKRDAIGNPIQPFSKTILASTATTLFR